MRNINVHNPKHLGDCILAVHFLRKVCEKNEDINFTFYAGKNYLRKLVGQVGDMKDRISLSALRNKPVGSLNMWFASRRLPKEVGKYRGRYASNERYDCFHDMICEEWGIENPVPGKLCTVIDLPSILDPVDVDCDILLINSKSRSGYYRYEGQLFRQRAEEWSEKYKVLTTEPTIDGIPSARELDLSVIQIGHMATKAKYVVAVDTGTIHNCFNKWALESVEQWYILSTITTRTFNDRIQAMRSLSQVKFP